MDYAGRGQAPRLVETFTNLDEVYMLKTYDEQWKGYKNSGHVGVVSKIRLRGQELQDCLRFNFYEHGKMPAN